MTLPSENFQLIYAVVAQVPKGRVATYGQVASLAGLPRRARLVGYALRNLAKGNKLPWHRVVNANGKISERNDDGSGALSQRKRLEREGVQFEPHGGISLARYQWQSEDI
ncbi:MAG TPA: MGMT family protein [Rhodocyclaceae bacterium]|jgi:methylated-DNA-protein-cysteine methyltransferase-like protein|nr:MGMT family protein [Rhodocyclaceae bacterium]